jgi:hypothetical protein
LEGFVPSNEPFARRPVADTYQIAPAIALDADFDARWAAWVARGHAHEEIVRRKIGMFAGVLGVAAALLYAFLR